MVCFCDIPLSQIRGHKDTYGSFAIGLSKEWASSNRINPVLYVYPNSAISLHIYEIFDKSSDDIAEETFKLIQYVKPYKGLLKKESRKNILT